MSPKEIRRLIFDAKRIPAQRTTTYSIIRVFKDINEVSDIPLEKIEWSEEKFGSYFRLIKDERFRFRFRKRV
jgi:FO synthase subunit 2